MKIVYRYYPNLAFSGLLTLAVIGVGGFFRTQVGAFNDVSASTPYSTAIESLKSRGVIEGYTDDSFKPKASINRAEFLKIVLESRGKGDFSGDHCFPDVNREWFAKYVCTAKNENIVSGYPDGTFKPGQMINFPEAAKIMANAFGLNIQSNSADWYESYIRALEGSKAIPQSIDSIEHTMTRAEMAEIMWRLIDNKIDQTSKSYLNVKYPQLRVDLSDDAPQRATSCTDLQPFFNEASRSYYPVSYLSETSLGAPVPSMAPKTSLALDSVRTGGGGGAPDTYSETNVQVKGVDEGDIVKTDGQNLYIVQGSHIRIVKAYPVEKMSLLATIDIGQADFSPSDLYIDGSRLVVIGNSFESPPVPAVRKMSGAGLIAPDYFPFYGGNRTEVHIYDVSLPSQPKEIRTISFRGSQVSSRKIEGKVYLVMNESIHWFVPSPRPIPYEEEMLPTYHDSANSEKDAPVVKCADVIILPRIPNPQYVITAVIPVDGSNSAVQRQVILGSAENIYASLKNLYIAATDWQYNWRSDGAGVERTNLYRFAYDDDGLLFQAVGSVPGHILNQFSMDEFDRHFRIATTNGQSWDEQHPSISNVYVLNLDLQRTGSVENIAPGEQIYAVRFLGKRGYIVTFKKVDPFFVLDLSDAKNPAILGKLKIPGFSDYLHPYDDTHIIGFGKDAVDSKQGNFAWYQGLKMALFDVTDPTNPTELHRFIIGDRGSDSPLLLNHKALLFEKDRNLLAFPVSVAKLTDDQKKNDPSGSAYGETVFQGAYVFSIDTEHGFSLRGSITHYTAEDEMKMGSYYYGKNVDRIVRIGDALFTVSEQGVQSHDEKTVMYRSGLQYNPDVTFSLGREFDLSAGTRANLDNGNLSLRIDGFYPFTCTGNQCGESVPYLNLKISRPDQPVETYLNFTANDTTQLYSDFTITLIKSDYQTYARFLVTAREIPPPRSGVCPDNPANAWYASKDQAMCELIDFSCPKGQTAFFGKECGCGCK